MDGHNISAQQQNMSDEEDESAGSEGNTEGTDVELHVPSEPQWRSNTDTCKPITTDR